MKLGYADPPYIGCAHLYSDHPDYAGEVDHAALIQRLEAEFDGWVLHASATKDSMAVPRLGEDRFAGEKRPVRKISDESFEIEVPASWFMPPARNG